MKLLGSNKSEINKNENGENEVVLVHCDIVNNNYQQNWGVLYTYVSNKSFSQLLDISPTRFVF